MNNDPEFKKLCMARHIYREKIIDQLLPSTISNNENKRNKPKTDTWRDWWVARYGESYNEYVKQQRKRTK